MKWMLCRVFGHQRTLVAFTSNRFTCRRCGADLGRDIPAMPSPPAADLPPLARRATTSLRRSTRERSLSFGADPGRTSRTGGRTPHRLRSSGDLLNKSRAPQP